MFPGFYRAIKGNPCINRLLVHQDMSLGIKNMALGKKLIRERKNVQKTFI